MIHTRTVLLLLALLLLLGACSKRLRSAAPATGQAETDAAGGDLTTKAADIEVQTPKETGMEPDPAPKTDALPPAERDEAYWRKELTPEEYSVLREKGTERAFTGEYWDTKTDGVYRCAGCDEPLFRSDSKFDSGCGWPSFFEPLDGARLTETRDTTAGMVRTEITCKKCGGHLGHVFNDGPEPSGLRYCINSVSIDLQPKKAVDGEE